MTGLPAGAELALTPALAAEIEPRLAALRVGQRERALSDCTFNNLYLFRDVHQYRYRAGTWPVVAGRTYDGSAICIPLFGLDSAAQAADVLPPGDAWFYPVDDATLGALDPDGIETRCERNDADYLYAAEDFIDYAAPGLGHKRSLVERLRASSAVETMPLSAATRPDAERILEGWCADKGLAADAADALPCREALAGLPVPGRLEGFIHYVDGEPAGFVLTEALNPGVLVVRFAKGRVACEGITAWMFQHLARQGAPGLQWLNFEQDLGRANFRRSKLSFRPRLLLNKHRVRFRHRRS